MDIFKTRDELVSMAADELGIVGVGQSIASDDEAKIDGRVDGLLSELASRGVCYVANEDEIPVEWCGPLAELLANEVAVAFGKPKKNYLERESIEERLKVMIQRVASPNNYLRADNALSAGSSVLTLSRWTNGT